MNAAGYLAMGRPSKTWRLLLRYWPPVGAVALILSVYGFTLAPTVTFEDSGSFIAAAYCLGVAHPPGYPLWCLLAHGFTHLPLASVAQRVHFCSAVCAAAAALLLYLIAYRTTRSRPASWTAALVFAFSSVFWSQAVIAEVYTLNAFLFGGIFYCAMRWRNDGRTGWLYGLALIGGLGLTNHPLFALIAPVPCIWAMTARWRMLLKPRTILVCMALFIAGLSVYAYIPWRARAHPPVNWGNSVTWRDTVRHALRRAYYTEPERCRYAGSQKDAWRHMTAAVRESGTALTWPVTVLAVFGWAVLTRRRRDAAGMTLAVIVMNIVALNLLLRGTAAPDEFFTRRVFYIPAQMMLALWLAVAVKRLMVFTRMNHHPSPSWHSWLRMVPQRLHYIFAGRWSTAACWFLPFLILMVNWPANDRSRDTLARDFGLELLASAPPGAGLFFVHDEALFPCLYLKVVEGLRPDLQIIESFFFGYQGQAISAVISDVPPNDEMLKYYSYLRGAKAVPWGLAYRLVRDSADMPSGMFFAKPVRDPPMNTLYDPSARRAYAAYACYHARLGADRFLAGEIKTAEHEWAISERLKVDDPYAHYILALMYRRCGLNPDRQKSLLQTALTLYRAQYSPSEFRFYPLTEKKIVSEIEGDMGNRI